jgi:hypothetical protein
MSWATCAPSSACCSPAVDGAELARLRPAQRREDVLAALRNGGKRLLEDARPGAVAVLYAATSDGVALVLPAAAGGKLLPRAERLASAAAAALAEAAELPTPARAGDVEIEAARWEGQVALRIAHPAAAEVLEILPLTLEDHAQELDRVRLEPVLLPAGDLDDTEPAAEERWLWRAEIAGRLGGRPGAAALAPEVEAAVASLESGFAEEAEADPAIDVDPLPRRRAARRMLRRLDGMGKYGGYHTEFRHLARGFAGHERALALEVGEALLRAGLLAEKPSVGQRHVSLVAARTNEIRALVERGTCEEPLRSLLA